MFKKGTGALPSGYDMRDFVFQPLDKSVAGVQSGGVKYTKKDINDQHKVGICTAISTTQNAQKATKIKYSADFQYLMQKKFVDGNWKEGSALRSALRVASKYGLLPAKYWTHTTEDDRKLSYEKYIKKLQAVPDAEIARLIAIASKYKILAYLSVNPNRLEDVQQALRESESGLLTRYAIGKEWWTKPIVPIRRPAVATSGHAVTDASYRGEQIAVINTWGTDWANDGQGYRFDSNYRPTEAWLVYYSKLPESVEEQIKERETLIGKLKDKLQMIIKVVQ